MGGQGVSQPPEQAQPSQESDSTDHAASSRPVPLIEHAMVNEVPPTEPFGAPADKPLPPPQNDSNDGGSDQS